MSTTIGWEDGCLPYAMNLYFSQQLFVSQKYFLTRQCDFTTHLFKQNPEEWIAHVYKTVQLSGGDVNEWNRVKRTASNIEGRSNTVKAFMEDIKETLKNTNLLKCSNYSSRPYFKSFARGQKPSNSTQCTPYVVCIQQVKIEQTSKIVIAENH